jgi:hypothetical protein
MDMSLAYDQPSIEPSCPELTESQSWQQVFDRIADIAVDRVAEWVSLMETKSQGLINTSDKLRALFYWATEMANASEENLDNCAKQVEALSLAIDRASQLARARARGPDRIPCAEQAKDLDAAAKSAHAIACTLDEKIIKNSQFSRASVSRRYADEIVQTWYRGELNPYLLELSKEEAEGLKNFFYVHELITSCYALSSQLSPDAGKEMQSKLLHPFIDRIQSQVSELRDLAKC